MDNLPNELRQDILWYLATEDVKSIRCTSKEWAALGQDYLLQPTFYSLPHRDDFTRMLQISRHPVEGSVKSLVFNLAEMNDYQARHNIWFLNYTRDLETRRTVLEEAWKDYAVLDACKTKFAKKCCNPEILREAFENFTRVKSLEVRMKECPFDNKLLQRLWNIPSTQQAHRNMDTERLSRILMNCAPLKLDAFAHDRLAMEFFRQDLKSLKQQFLGFSELRHLHLDLTHGAVEEYEFQAMMAKLSSCLRSVENLHTLHIGFKRRAQHSRIMSAYLVECTWPRLQKLHISGVTVSQVDLIAFLTRHSSSLRICEFGMANSRVAHLSSPEWYGIEISGSTGKDFFTSLSQILKLEILDMRGTFHFKIATEQAYGEPDPLGEEYWNFEGCPDAKASLERFVVEGGEWPKCWPQ